MATSPRVRASALLAIVQSSFATNLNPSCAMREATVQSDHEQGCPCCGSPHPSDYGASSERRVNSGPDWSRAELVAAEDLLSCRWTLQVLGELAVEPRRYTDLKREVRGISWSVLTDRLSHLEDAAVIERTFVREYGAVVYRLAAKGSRVPALLAAAAAWACAVRTSDHAEP